MHQKEVSGEVSGASHPRRCEETQALSVGVPTVLQKAAKGLHAREIETEDEIWAANTFRPALSPSLHWGYEPQLL